MARATSGGAFVDVCERELRNTIMETKIEWKEQQLFVRRGERNHNY